jgi:transcriptional regulator of acetoin/glycerol metabolism
MLYSWPGNVRELYNVLLNMAVMKKDGILADKPDFSGSGFGIAAGKNKHQKKSRQEAILNLGNTMESFSIRDCQAAIPVSLSTIQRDLRKLLRSGKITVEGKGPSVQYKKA